MKGFLHKLKLKKLFIIVATSAVLAACSTDPVADVEITLETNRNYGTLIFNIQAVTDATTVKNVVINRGNCHIPVGTAKDLERGVELKFGKSYRGYSNNCKVGDVREVEITTSVGSFIFSFD